jgi:hypothetical protein
MKTTLTILSLIFFLIILPGQAQEMSKKESRIAAREERLLDKAIKREHQATSRYLSNKSKLKKYNKEYNRSSRKFEREKKREKLSPREIRSWEADLRKQENRIQKLQSEIDRYQREFQSDDRQTPNRARGAQR